MVTEGRVCAQCGAVFTPRREHARFCSAGCRSVWHQNRTGELIAGDSVLQWTVPAMTESIGSLSTVNGPDRPAAYAAISDAVWAVTMVDAAMMRRHPGIYDEVLAGEAVPDRRLVEESLAVLRFVRNHIPDHAAVAAFATPAIDPPAGGFVHAAARAPVMSGVRDWRWQSVATPVFVRRSAHA